MNIDRVAVIGTGLMGPGIASIVVLAGHNVTLIGTNPDKATAGGAKAHRLMEQLVSDDLTNPAVVERAKRGLHATADLDAAKHAQIAIEAINENLELKQQTFQRLDRLTLPQTRLTTTRQG